jgi:hypothetical protein
MGLPYDGGVTGWAECAVKLRLRTEDEERVRAHRKSLKGRITRGKRERAPGPIRTVDLRIRSPLSFARILASTLISQIKEEVKRSQGS